MDVVDKIVAVATIQEKHFMNDELIVNQSLNFLRRIWPHSPRSIEERDQGFERQFREYIFHNLEPEKISASHDLGFAAGTTTLTGLPHELDLIARWENQEWVFELKHGGGSGVNKEMLMVFNEKVLDFYLANYGYLSSLRIMRCFMTGANRIEDNLRSYCAIWGIVLIDDEMISIPLLPQAFREKRQQVIEGKLVNAEVEEVALVEDDARKLAEQACRPLGDLIELSDLSKQLTIRLDRMAEFGSGITLVQEHRRLYEKYSNWRLLLREKG